MDKSQQLERPSRADALWQDMLRYVPSSVIPAIIGVFSAAIFTRMFAPAEYGKLILVYAVTGPVVSVFGQMFGQPAARYYSELRRDGLGVAYSRLVSTIIQRMGIIEIAVVLVLIGITSLLHLSPTWLLLLIGAAASVGLQSIASLLLRPLLLSRDFRAYQNYIVGTSILGLFIALTLVFVLGAHIVYLIWGSAISLAIMLVPLVKRTQPVNPIRLLSDLYGEVERGILRQFLGYGLPMAVWFFATSMIETSDRYVIGAYLGSTAVAIYGSSYTIGAQVIALLTGVIITATWPRIMTTWARTKDAEQVKAIMKHATDLYLMLGVGLVGGSVIVRQDVVGILLSPKYFDGYKVLPAVMAGVILMGASLLGHKSMEVMERNDVMVRNAIVAAVANILLNILLVPRFGWPIAAYTTLLSYFVYGATTWVMARRFIPWEIDFIRTGLYLVLAALADVVSAHVFGVRPFVGALLVRGAVFSLIYFGINVCWLLRTKRRLVGRTIDEHFVS